MEFFVDNINLVLILPLAVCLLIAGNALTISKIEKRPMYVISFISAVLCFVFSLFTFIYSMGENSAIESSFLWLSSDTINFYLGSLVDNVSVTFLLIATILNLIIQPVAYVKLKEMPDYNRLLFYQNLFALGLFGIFLAPNILQAYMLCEIVGVACYLLINFDFSNKTESKAAIRSFIFNRIGDLTLLFCVLTILYFSVTYNQLWNNSNLAFTNMMQIAESINSLMSTPIFVGFCSLLIFVVLMKFMQSFIYLTFVSKMDTPLAKIILSQNSFIVLIGVYLLLRFNPFFVNLGSGWGWSILIILFLFMMIGLLNKLFIPMCKAAGWIEKYIVDTFLNFVELIIRFCSYLCCRLQAGSFQSYILYSLIGLVILLAFVLIFYIMVMKI